MSTAAQDAKKPSANGVLVQMEQGKPKKEEEEEEKSHNCVRTETAELLNGDVGSAEQSEDYLPAHTDRTAAENHATNEDSETKTESVRKSEGCSDHKVCTSPSLCCKLHSGFFFLFCF